MDEEKGVSSVAKTYAGLSYSISVPLNLAVVIFNHIITCGVPCGVDDPMTQSLRHAGVGGGLEIFCNVLEVIFTCHCITDVSPLLAKELNVSHTRINFLPAYT